MTPVDDLSKGLWITVVEDFENAEASGFNGVPLQVLAICLPFIAVSSPAGTTTVDVRRYGVQKCSKQYVQAMSGYCTPKPKKQKRTKLSTDQCPRCHARMIQRLWDKGVWRLVCPECGLAGGPVK